MLAALLNRIRQELAARKLAKLVEQRRSSPELQQWQKRRQAAIVGHERRGRA